MGGHRLVSFLSGKKYVLHDSEYFHYVNKITAEEKHGSSFTVLQTNLGHP